MAPEWAPTIWPSIGPADLEVHVACSCGHLDQLPGGVSLWQALAAWARHVAQAHPADQLLQAGALAALVSPALEQLEDWRG